MEIMPGIYQVDGVNAHSYIITGKEGATIIDAGMFGNTKKIIKYAEKIGLKPSDIKTIVLTHHHMDHTGSLSNLKKATGANVAIHKEDADYLSGKKKQEVKSKGLRPMLLMLLMRFMQPKPVEPEILLEEGDKVGGLTVIHTPGHTPGSISLYDPDRKVIYVGDALRYVNGKIEGPPGARFTSDPEMAKQSIGKISSLDFDVMLSGHGEALRPKASEKVREFYRTL